MTARHSFATRLALAHAMITRGAPAAPGYLADQVDAAAADTRVLHDRIGQVMPLLEPERHWRQRVAPSPSTGTRAYLLAALLDCTTVCCHLRRGGPQPAIASLPLRRIDCERCVGTIRRPPPDEADRCDVCGARGVATFHPFAVRQGPLLLVGDACPNCADVLGIRSEEAAS